MAGAIDIFGGYVWVKLNTPRPEGTINMLAVNGIGMGKVRRTADGAVKMRLPTREYKKLLALAERGGFEVETLRERGVLRHLRRIKKRYALAAGALACFVLVQVSSLFIWEIRVCGNETVPTAEILSALEKHGVGIGTFRLTVAYDFLANDMMLSVPSLSWISVNTRGSRAEVVVREETPKPEMIDRKTPSVIRAVKDGIIEKMTVTSGKKTVSVGDEVKQGDMLVTGEMENMYSGARFVGATADITARTWYEISAQMPLETQKKVYTGEEKTRFAVILGGKRINLYFSGGNPWASYDKITKYSTSTLPNGTVLPLTVVTERYAEYETYTETRPCDEAAVILKARLMASLEEQINGGIISVDWLEREENGTLTVTLFAECLENIGQRQAVAETEDTAGNG